MSNLTPFTPLEAAVEKFKSTLLAVEAAVRAADSASDVLSYVCRVLQTLDGYTGVYIYTLEGDTLVLSAFAGRATEHVRIPAGTGICGASVQSRSTVVVDDVSSDPRYLACNCQTRSEIVVPILKGERYLAQIDVDSDGLATFGPLDQAFLAEVASTLAPLFDC